MMKNVFIAFLCMFASIAYAQQDTMVSYHDSTGFDYVDSSYFDFIEMRDSVFNNLDFEDITSNLLIERSIFFLNPELYAGTVHDSNVLDYYQFRSLYAGFYFAAIDTTNRPMTVDDMDETVGTSGNTIKIPVLNLKYHRIKDNAFDDSLLIVDGMQLFDVPGRSESPYQENTVFAAAPDYYEHYGSSISFVIPESLFFTNLNKTLSSFEIDFGDSTGYQSGISLNQTVNVNYLDSGLKEIKVKVIYTDQTTYETHFFIHVTLPIYSMYYNSTYDDFFTINATAEHKAAKAFIFYGCGNIESESLRKPLLIVEGFDPAATEIGDNNGGYNGINWERIDKMINEDLIRDESVNIQEEGYDVIYIDFEDGGDYIQNNAKALEVVIDSINNRKSKCGSYEKNIVVGTSMGGVVARYALVEMESSTYMAAHDGKSHDTRLFISFDSPQLGANIPLGFQYLVSIMYHNFWLPIFIPELRIAYNSMTCPAARQMLIFQTNDNNKPSLYMDFYHDLIHLNSNHGFPEKCRNIAISNGSQEQDPQGFGDHFQMLDVSGNYKKYGIVNAEIDMEVYALPNYTDERITFISMIQPISIGSLKIPLPIQRPIEKRIQYHPPIDNAPGGWANMGYFNMREKDIKGYLPDAVVSMPNDGLFNFIPTISSLSVEDAYYFSPGIVYPTDLYYDVKNSDIVTNNYTKFKKYASSPDPGFNNSEHVSIQNSNAELINNEAINTLSNTTGDSRLPAPPSYINEGYFNYGRNDDYFQTSTDNVGSVTVSGTGKMYINNDLAIGINGSSMHNPSTGSSFSVVTRRTNCDNVNFTISDGGELVIGDNSVNNVANLIISSGSEIILGNDAVLTINDHSKLIIEEGGTLFIGINPQIELDGENAVLEIRGNLVLATDATFAPTGTGYVIFNAISGGTVFADENSSIEFSGSGSNDKVLEIKRFSLRVYNDNNSTFLSSFKISNGKVEMGDGAKLLLGADNIELNNVKFSNLTGETNLFNGVYIFNIYNSPNVTLNNITIENANEGMHLINPDKWKIKNLHINNTQYPLYTDGGSVIFEYLFIDGSQHPSGYYGNGWIAQNMTSTSKLIGSEIKNMSGNGISFHGISSSSRLEILSGAIRDNTGIGVSIYNSSLNGRCGIISDNICGIYSDDGVVELSKDVSISGIMDVSLNQINNIHISNCNGLYVNNGLNDFRTLNSDDYALYGDFRIKDISPALPQLNANYNVWKNNLPYNNIVYYFKDNPFLGVSAYIETDYKLSTYNTQSCNDVQYDPNDDWWTHHASCTVPENYDFPVITTAAFTEVNLKDAIEESMIQMYNDTIDGYLNASDMFSQILNVDYPSVDSVLQDFLDFAYFKMIESVGSALLTGQAVIDSNNIYPAQFQYVLDVTQKLGDSVAITDTSSYLRKFMYTYDLASLLFTFRHYEEALVYTDSILNWVEAEETDQLDHLICQTNLKIEIRDNEYSLYQIDSLLQNACPYNYFPEAPEQFIVLNNKKDEDNLSDNQKSKLIIQNPVKNLIRINYPLNYGENANIRIYDAQGKLLDQKIMTSNSYEINISNYPKGLYILNFSAGNTFITQKFIKE